ncbi:PREDICTED: lysosomal alpha-mannosidase-like isoform X2 [Eufriesea mexicana]|uniref:lysosomal alpha-mannosidase-like isoform X2 n=1 Tax=Eufriesea mexicana TaxID=516756 RepID=UPI00083C7477|nr:PREDICTED: lysosomal alpha-mannosidase-like isoform X2 [Eufriesea mexicana]
MLWPNSLLPLILFLLLFIYGESASIRRKVSQTCGYEACHETDPNKLNIHLVAHTHDDVGWLKTIDQYYFGSRPKLQKAGVQYILDSVIQALVADPERKFIYVETAFLWKWWLRQNEEVKETVRNLINEGRLEIISGGWTMNDEATTHYQSLVDQYTWGFRRLNDTFGSCARPHIGWQIDPFGHSREQASLLAQLGFDGMFLGRLDYQDKANRLKEKTMEFIWKGSPNLGTKADLFTVALYNTYSPPPGFCYDVLCNDEPIIDDPDSPDYNVDERIHAFMQYVVDQSKVYRTNDVILTMGGDFTYQQAEMYFFNMDKLIRYVTEKYSSHVNIFYSTPSCYLKAVHLTNSQWPTKDDDFFPYASDEHSYWTGYFSSRPTIKFFERMGNNLLQISKQLSVLTHLQDNEKELEQFREAMGVLQHHDAVTGTEKQLVAEDYARLLSSGMQQGMLTSFNALSKWRSSGNPDLTKENIYSCTQLNISDCLYTERQNFVLAIYNPLSQNVVSPIRVPVQEGRYKVMDLTSEHEVISQMVPIPKSVQEVPGRKTNATHELVFLTSLPPLGYKSYTVTKIAQEPSPEVEAIVSIGNEFYDVSVNEYGHVVVQWKKEKNMSTTQSFHYYEGMEGNNEISLNRSSGAYIFRPRNVPIRNFVKPGSYKIYKGPLVQEIHQYVTDWISQVIRVYNGMQYIEFNWLVGPIPVEDKIGKEIVTRYSSNLNSSGEFYTDSNGREMLKRKRNYRQTWNLKIHEEISSNYYPVTSKISLKDEQKFLKLSVLTDRTEGGTSMHDGEIEMMVHRRLLKDDAFGVGEALNESAYGEGLVVRGSHYIIGGSIKNLDELALKEKSLALQLLLRPWLFIIPAQSNSRTHMQYASEAHHSGLTKLLPSNIHILTLEPWKNGTVLLRLEHIFEVGESETLSKPVEINIQDLFTTFTIVSIKETTLGGNQWYNDLNRLKWRSETNEVLEKEENISQPVEINSSAINVLLTPMEIRTFILTVTPKKL